MKRGPIASDLTTAYMVGPITSEENIYSNAFISSMYCALCVSLQVPKSGSVASFSLLASASINSGIFVATMCPAILPKFSEPMCSEPPSTSMNDVVGFLSTSLTDPWNPISPIWCVPQECGQPEMCKRGSFLVSTPFASRCVKIAFNRPLES